MRGKRQRDDATAGPCRFRAGAYRQVFVQQRPREHAPVLLASHDAVGAEAQLLARQEREKRKGSVVRGTAPAGDEKDVLGGAKAAVIISAAASSAQSELNTRYIV